MINEADAAKEGEEEGCDAMRASGRVQSEGLIDTKAQVRTCT